MTMLRWIPTLNQDMVLPIAELINSDKGYVVDNPQGHEGT